MRKLLIESIGIALSLLLLLSGCTNAETKSTPTPSIDIIANTDIVPSPTNDDQYEVITTKRGGEIIISKNSYSYVASKEEIILRNELAELYPNMTHRELYRDYFPEIYAVRIKYLPETSSYWDKPAF